MPENQRDGTLGELRLSTIPDNRIAAAPLSDPPMNRCVGIRQTIITTSSGIIINIYLNVAFKSYSQNFSRTLID